MSRLLSYKLLIPTVLPLAHVGLTGSVYLTLAIALERYTTVCHPYFKVGCATRLIQRRINIWDLYFASWITLNRNKQHHY